MKSPLTVEDFVLLQGALAIEIVAACSPRGEVANRRLTELASKLLDVSNAMTEPRGKTIIHALAAQIIATE